MIHMHEELDYKYVWLPRKTRRNSLGLVLSYDPPPPIFFLGMGTLVGAW
jgi:hypothetical protein